MSAPPTKRTQGKFGVFIELGSLTFCQCIQIDPYIFSISWDALIAFSSKNKNEKKAGRSFRWHIWRGVCVCVRLQTNIERKRPHESQITINFWKKFVVCDILPFHFHCLCLRYFGENQITFFLVICRYRCCCSEDKRGRK